MSVVTKEWTVRKIRYVILNLDKKTGLHGADLPIVLIEDPHLGGRYEHRREPNTVKRIFYFNIRYFNDPSTQETEVIGIIRHEYAHYYVEFAKIGDYVPHSPRQHSHGSDFRWACRMVGALPYRSHVSVIYGSALNSEEGSMSLQEADDIPELDIRAFIKKQRRVPTDKELETLRREQDLPARPAARLL